MERAQAWLKRYGRPLEMALWDFHFAGGSKENVIRYLSAFQNEDGVSAMGWNRISGPKSSPMASWMAGQILVEIKADLSDEIVERLIQYLMTCEQVLPGMWPRFCLRTTTIPMHRGGTGRKRPRQPGCSIPVWSWPPSSFISLHLIVGSGFGLAVSGTCGEIHNAGGWCGLARAQEFLAVPETAPPPRGPVYCTVWLYL